MSEVRDPKYYADRFAQATGCSISPLTHSESLSTAGFSVQGAIEKIERQGIGYFLKEISDGDEALYAQLLQFWNLHRVPTDSPACELNHKIVVADLLVLGNKAFGQEGVAQMFEAYARDKKAELARAQDGWDAYAAPNGLDLHG